MGALGGQLEPLARDATRTGRSRPAQQRGAQLVARLRRRACRRRPRRRPSRPRRSGRRARCRRRRPPPPARRAMRDGDDRERWCTLAEHRLRVRHCPEIIPANEDTNLEHAANAAERFTQAPRGASLRRAAGAGSAARLRGRARSGSSAGSPRPPSRSGRARRRPAAPMRRRRCSPNCCTVSRVV